MPFIASGVQIDTPPPAPKSTYVKDQDEDYVDLKSSVKMIISSCQLHTKNQKKLSTKSK